MKYPFVATFLSLTLSFHALPSKAGEDSSYGLPSAQKLDPAPELKELQQLANQGNASAQARLGWIHSQGRVVKMDFKEAAKWYQLAADQGNAHGQAGIGMLYVFGWGVTRDYAEARNWLQRAADQGNAGGQVGLGWIYANALGVPQNHAQARMLYQLAAGQGDTDAKKRLEWMNAARLGVPGEISLLPKYGGNPKDELSQAADREFITRMDKYYSGDRRKAAEILASRGWTLFRQNKTDEAMQQFNKAWLINHSNGSALWGMAVIEGNRPEKVTTSLELFAEAAAVMGNDVDFSVDHARTISLAGMKMDDQSMVNDALARFSRLQNQAPQHVLNLQNWAITLFHLKKYAQAWEVIKLAEGMPRSNELDPRFIAALQRKMPRP